MQHINGARTAHHLEVHSDRVVDKVERRRLRSRIGVDGFEHSRESVDRGGGDLVHRHAVVDRLQTQSTEVPPNAAKHGKKPRLFVGRQNQRNEGAKSTNKEGKKKERR